MVSRENQVIIASAILAILLLYVLATFTNLPSWVSIAVVIVVGVLVPQLVNESLGNDR